MFQTYRYDEDLNPIMRAEPVPPWHARLDRLPNRTRVVGDLVRYETETGEGLSIEVALRKLKRGEVVHYTTWQEEPLADALT